MLIFQSLICAVLEHWFMQHWVDYMHFFYFQSQAEC